jgi:hypothetical protein
MPSGRAESCPAAPFSVLQYARFSWKLACRALERLEVRVSDIHITREILRAVARGEMPALVVAEIGLSHLLSLCGTCEEEFRAYQQEIASPLEYGSALRVIPALLERHGPDEEKKRAAA